MILQNIDKLIIELDTISTAEKYIKLRPNISLIFKKSKKVLIKNPDIQDGIVDASTGLLGD